MNELAKSQQRKGIQTQLTKLKVKQKGVRSEITALETTCVATSIRISALEHQLDALQSKGPPVVSEHAIIQYLNLTNFRVDSLVKTIMDVKTQALVAELGSGKYPIEGTGLRAVVKDNTVVTVIGRKRNGRTK